MIIINYNQKLNQTSDSKMDSKGNSLQPRSLIQSPSILEKKKNIRKNS